MQTDAWLTDTAYPERCPLCNQPLAGASNTCPACGFTAHEPAGKPTPAGRSPMLRQPNPVTPIPARASARRAQSRPGMVPRRQQAEAGHPASAASGSVQQGSGWQHESRSYEAASSLSSLSLIISETPTAPPRSQRSTGRLEHVDEIDTVPQVSEQTRAVRPASDRMPAVLSSGPETPDPAAGRSLSFADLDVSHLAVVLSETTPPVTFPAIDEIDTVPESGSQASRALAPLPATSREMTVDAASWTTGARATRSLAARFVAERSPRRRRSRAFTPLDRTRWWLLRPGHIEFVLWTAGSLLLFGVTFVILLATVLSVMLPGVQASGNFPNSDARTEQTTPVSSPATSAGVHLTLSGRTSLVPGEEIRLLGTGFQPQSVVVFLLDGHLALLDQHGQAASAHTDKSGRFAVNLWLGQGSAWQAGRHFILVRETSGGRQASLAITLVSSTASTSGVQSTPVTSANPTPVATTEPATPTPAPPASTPTTSTTPVPTSVPSPQPTRGVTATPGSSGTSTVAQQTPGLSPLGNSLTSESNDSLLTRLAHLNPLIWLIGVCYFIALVLLGVAGLLRRRR